jgi:hypothetical protein
LGTEKHRLHWNPDAVVYTMDQFRDWMFSAPQGDRCLYHIGQMLTDQEDRPHLKFLGDYAALMSEFGAVVITQRRVDAGMYQYFAARREFKLRSLPKAVATGEIPVRLFLSLRAVNDRSSDVSARRAIRDALSCSEDESQEMLEEMMKTGLVKKGRPPKITDAGKAVLI